MITEKSDSIQINGWRGYWHVIDSTYYKSVKVFLLEHNTYGDMTESLIVDSNGNVILDDVWNGFSDLDEMG